MQTFDFVVVVVFDIFVYFSKDHTFYIGSKTSKTDPSLSQFYIYFNSPIDTDKSAKKKKIPSEDKHIERVKEQGSGMVGATITSRNNYFTALTSRRRLEALAPKATHLFLPMKLTMPRSCHLLARKKFQMPVCGSKQNYNSQQSYPNSPLMEENMLFVIGIDPQQAPPKAFDHFQLYDEEELSIAVDELARLPYVGESAILNIGDCFEIYAVALPPAGVREIINWMAERCGIYVSEFEKFCYVHSGNDTAKHLLDTVAGFYVSNDQKKLIGDKLRPTITQLRGTKGYGAILRALFEHADALHRRLRCQYDEKSPDNLCSAAVDLALREFTTSLAPEPKVLVIEAGTSMATLITEKLVAKGFGTINVLNLMKWEEAPSIHKKVKGARIVYEPFEDFASSIGKADIVFMCEESLNAIIFTKHLEEINCLSLESGRDKKKIFVDVSFNKNVVADGASDLPFVQVLDIDDIKKLKLEEEYKQQMILQAEASVGEQSQKFRHWVQFVGNVEVFKLFQPCIMQNYYGFGLLKEDRDDFSECYRTKVANYLKDLSEACATGADDNYILQANLLLSYAAFFVV